MPSASSLNLKIVAHSVQPVKHPVSIQPFNRIVSSQSYIARKVSHQPFRICTALDYLFDYIGFRTHKVTSVPVLCGEILNAQRLALGYKPFYISRLGIVLNYAIRSMISPIEKRSVIPDAVCQE